MFYGTREPGPNLAKTRKPVSKIAKIQNCTAEQKSSIFFSNFRSSQSFDICFSISVNYTFYFYKKLGSGHSTKSFLISHEILSILVLKVS